jgi:hypothetical protein
MRHLLICGALGATLAVAGCTAPRSGPSPSAPSSAPAAAPSSLAPAPVLYDARGLDLCARTDLGPVRDLAPTTKRTNPTPPPSGSGAACVFELTGPGGVEASLRVEASTLPTADEAGRLYRATQDVTVMSADGPIQGVAEEAEGYARDHDVGGVRYSEYLIHARRGNLVVKVFLSVGGDQSTPKEDLASRTLTITKTTLAAVPRA